MSSLPAPPEADDPAGADIGAAASQAIVAALAGTPLRLALVDAGGALRWCSPAFAQAVGRADAAACIGASLVALLGADAAAPLRRRPPVQAAIGAHTVPAATAAVVAAAGAATATATAPRAVPGTDGRPATLAAPATPATPATPRWSLRLESAGDGARLALLEPLDEAAALRLRTAWLQERLDLVQEFCAAGIFERDPVTMEGRWDAWMYRIFGLPERAPGAPAPPYAEVAMLMYQEDRTRGGFRHSMHESGVHSDRVRLRRPDGSVRHIHSQWKVEHDAHGRPVRVLGVNRDDTESRALAASAQALREELDHVLDLGQIGMWRHDLASDRVRFDERACRQLGIAHDPLGLSRAEARALLHPDDVAVVTQSAEETLRTGQPTDMTVRYRRADGGWMHMLSRRTLERDLRGEPVAFVGVLLDDTERVEKAQQALALARRLDTAAQAARIGLWSARAADPRPDWNRRMFELFGLDPAAPALTLGDWMRRCLHPDDRDRVAAEVLGWVRQGAGAIDIEFRVVRPSDGAVRWLVVRGQTDAGAAAAERRYEGVAIDITEQQETLQRLRESAERVELTQSAVGLGAWELDVGRDLGVWDEGMFRLRGVASARREITRDEIASYLHPDDRQAVMDDDERRRRGGESWRSTFRVVWPDGTVRWLASRSAPVRDAAGRTLRRIGLNWDVTESVLAEQAMRERELALAESRAKSRFMSRVSHELRTPLNAVLGFTQLLRDDRAAGDVALRQRWLNQIETAGRHLLALIDDVLSLSRVEAGEMRLTLEPVALAQLVASTLPLVEREARAAGVELAADVASIAGVVQADPVRLRQVLLNLLSNAIKYNRAGGRVRLTSRVEAGEVALDVADSGRGIDPEALRHAFEPFNRLGAEASGIPGTGIGLAITKALVEGMGGRVEAWSRPGEGSRFTFVLPRSAGLTASMAAERMRAEADALGLREAADAPGPPAAAASTSTPAPGGAAAAAAPARVLYIEDNPVNALLLRELLEPRDWVTLEVAADGRSGLARAREWRPDLILLDMQLPDLHGLAVLQALRKDPALAAIPCVALSANAMPADIEAARAAGAVDYWTKPIQFEPFLASLARLLQVTV